MSYSLSYPPESPALLGPNAGHHVLIGSNNVRMILTGKTTQGKMGLFALELAPGGPVALPHLHRELTEIFTVISGEVELRCDDRSDSATSGSVMYVPPGTVHGFANKTDQPAEVLVGFLPGGNREEYFYQIAELLEDGKEPDPAKLKALAESFDQYAVETDYKDQK